MCQYWHRRRSQASKLAGVSSGSERQVLTAKADTGNGARGVTRRGYQHMAGKSNGQIKAIETVYKGYRFRSRLEARWAVFFDALGVKWEYEKEGFDLGEAGWYLPDFWLPDLKVWAEIKPSPESKDGFEKAYILSAKSKGGVLIIRGEPGPCDDLTGQYPFDMVIFLGESWDTYADYSDVWWGAKFAYFWDNEHFGRLTEFLQERVLEDKYLHEDDLDLTPIPKNILDESTRREALVYLDKLYFWRAYGKEHDTWKFGRHYEGRLKFDHKNRLQFDEGDRFQAAGARIEQALLAARQARFEHGENGVLQNGKV
jgi:hypothetical protein